MLSAMSAGGYSTRRKKRSKLCYLCGKPNTDTKDHVPPRGIFPAKPKGQLLTVPAHRDCNEKYAEDDELFRNLIIAGSGRTAEGEHAWNEQVVPSWKENRGAKRRLQERMVIIWVRDPKSGLFIPRKALGGDVPVFEREIDRCTRGLYYRKFNKPYPPSQEIKMDKLQPPEISIPDLNRGAARDGVKLDWIHVEPNIFAYSFQVSPENMNAIIAFFIFFNTDVFMASASMP